MISKRRAFRKFFYMSQRSFVRIQLNSFNCCYLTQSILFDFDN